MNDIIENINRLTKLPWFFYSYLAVIRLNLFFPEWEILKINHAEKLNFQEISFLTGLLLRNWIDMVYVPNEEEMHKQIDLLYQYLAELHNCFLREIPYSEPIFYGDSWVYDFQCVNFASLIYSQDAKWLEYNKNISLDTSVDFRRRVLDTTHAKINNKIPFENLINLAKKTYEDLSFHEKDIPAKFLPYFSNFSCLPKWCNNNYSHPMEFNQVESTPFILIDDSYFLPISFLLAHALYTTPFYWMLEDSKYYNSIGQQNRWKANEWVCLYLTKDIVGENNSYSNIIIKDKKGNDITEIDTLLIIWNRAIIIQAKSKKMTEIAKKWDIQKLEKDFQEAIQDAYNQWLKCRTALINREHSLWVEWKRIELKEPIVDAYILCITLDHYPAVIFQSMMLLKHQEWDPLPVCMSVFDLEIMCHYLKNKFDLLFYLHQRVKHSKQIISESEISLLWFHLNQKLWFDDKGYDMVNILSDFWSLIDAHFPVEKGRANKTNEYEKLYPKWSNPTFNSIVEKLIDTNEACYTDAVLFLYGLSGDSIDDLINAVSTLRGKTRVDKKTHDCSMLFGNHWITIKVFPNDATDITSELLNHAMSRKYKSKWDLRIWLGFYSDNKSIVDAVCFGKFDWEYDEQLEKLTKDYLTSEPTIVNGKLEPIKLGRNAPCFCWSWKKYKKCCLNI